MGTSKSYVTKVSKEHTAAKRNLTKYISNSSEDKLKEFVRAYADCTQQEGNYSKRTYASGISKLASFIIVCQNLGVKSAINSLSKVDSFTDTLDVFNYLIDNDNNLVGLDRDILSISIVNTIEDLEIKELDSLKSIKIEDFLVQIIANIIANRFEQRYYEHIKSKVDTISEAQKNVMK